MKKTYHVALTSSLSRALPIVPVSPSLNIAFLKLYGDVELTEACAELLGNKIKSDVDVIVGPESGGILLAHLVSMRKSIPYVLARKKWRPNMINPISIELETIGTKGTQKLWLDDDDIQKVKSKKIAIIDEVISSGATVNALTQLIKNSGGEVIQVLAVATEGEEHEFVEKLIHLPLFEGE